MIKITQTSPRKIACGILIALCFFLIACILSSCGSVNKLKKKTETKIDSTSVTKTISTQTITEKADTTAFTKKDSLQTTTTQEQLAKGDTLTTESAGIKIETFENIKTKQITTKVVTKPQAVHLFIDKKQVIKINTDTDVEVKKDIKQETKTVEKTGFQLGWKGWLMIVFFLLLILLYFIARKKFTFLP